MEHEDQQLRADSLFVPGVNCCEIAHADRLACVIDAADYFRIAKSAMLGARRRIMLIGWDFDTRIELEPDGPTLDGPNKLGDFLNWLPKNRPDLEIYLLKWSVGAVTALTRGMAPIFVLNWLNHPRVHLQIDTRHPLRGAHHQKIVVIDDAIAFCGGIDMTVDRWDRSGHADRDTHRVTPTGTSYGPWHDATTAVDGAAARAVGAIARSRWQSATGQALDPVPTLSGDRWPTDLEPTMRSVDVAVSRTLPQLDDRAEIREIEQLYLTAIRSARHYLYIESQYLAARSLVEAMAARLEEPDGPEIVVVLPRHADGWLEQQAMDGARERLLHLLWRADHHGRFRALYPVTVSGQPIYVHAKILIADDMLLRVGSSNLNNRSIGLDSECDLAVEATDDATGADHREAIRGVRDRLVAEHLDIEVERFGAEFDARGSLVATIGALAGDGKTLREFDRETVDDEASALAENDLVDPESSARPPILERTYRMLASQPLRRLAKPSRGRRS
ncbi:phospholipase D-like domain-containing protein [Gordonia sp. LSe1-13]|uniref:Phospholipase D-like domain-containing protein n=1 Tax=Gordonia sesuvii TaxID=3116777 RepID=A0ABU7MAG6_9ACTN|nr:phospholipase D-like domain-containing protein [Gordonia sp. LSe1-13]